MVENQANYYRLYFVRISIIILWCFKEINTCCVLLILPAPHFHGNFIAALGFDYGILTQFRNIQTKQPIGNENDRYNCSKPR